MITNKEIINIIGYMYDKLDCETCKFSTFCDGYKAINHNEYCTAAFEEILNTFPEENK